MPPVRRAVRVDPATPAATRRSSTRPSRSCTSRDTRGAHHRRRRRPRRSRPADHLPPMALEAGTRRRRAGPVHPAGHTRRRHRFVAPRPDRRPAPSDRVDEPARESPGHRRADRRSRRRPRARADLRERISGAAPGHRVRGAPTGRRPRRARRRRRLRVRLRPADGTALHAISRVGPGRWSPTPRRRPPT